jgi:hypothetical protein
MSRSCATCQHLKRSEIDRRLAAGEPTAQVARDFELNPSSLHRHRVNCLKLGSSNDVKKDAARGTAAMALMPSKETLNAGYFDLRTRIDEIVTEAKEKGSLQIALAGLNSIRHSLDSQARLAGHFGSGSQINVAVQTNVNIGIGQIVERVIEAFDDQPDVKARIARTLMEIDHDRTRSSGLSARSGPVGPGDPPH